MKKTYLLSILIFYSFLTNGQVIKYRAFEAAILDSMGELKKPIWLPTNLLVTMDTADFKIKIFSKEEAEYDIIEDIASKKGYNYEWATYRAVDKRGTKCDLKIFSIRSSYQSHILTIVIPNRIGGVNKLLAYRLRANEPIRLNETFPIKLTFNSATLFTWDSKKKEWSKNLPFFGYNTLITLKNDSSISITTQSISEKYGMGKKSTDYYKWENKKEKDYEEGQHTNYNLKLTKDSEFFIFNIYRFDDGSIKGVAFINDKATMVYMNTEIGY